MSIAEDLRDWSKNVLEVPNDHLQGLPACPYARKAWMEDKVCIIECEDVVPTAILNRLLVLDSYDLVVVASYTLPDIDIMQHTVEALNILCAKEDVYFMCFHPDFGAEDADLDFLYDTNWESKEEDDYCMIFVQRLSSVDDASKQLEQAGYYKHIPEEEYQTLVLHRRALREQYQNGDETSCND